MTTAKIIALLAGLAFIASNASPCSLTGSPTTSEAATSTTSLPAGTTCNMEGKRSGLSGLKPLGTYIGSTSPSECFDICHDEHHAARCKSFTYTPSSKTCVFWDIPVNVGGQAVPGTGVFYWDIACWAGHTASSTAAAPTSTPTGCLPSDAVCDVEGTFSDYEEFATYRGANSASECFEICNDRHHASRCVSFIYGLYTETCYFYDAPASIVMRPKTETTNNYFWDKACWTSSGSCASGTSSTSIVPSATTTTSTTSATTTSCIPPEAKCDIEGKQNNIELTYQATLIGADSAFECAEVCADHHHKPFGCISFGYTPSNKTCVYYNINISTVAEPQTGSDTAFWDMSCWCNEGF